MKSSKRKRRLTPLQKRFAENLAKDMPVKKAAELAGYSPTAAKSDAYAIQELPKIQDEVEDIRERNRRIAEKLGKGPEARLKKFVDLTNAKKVVTATEKGKITDEKVYDDGALQLSAAKELSRLCGDYPAEQHEITDKRPVRMLSPLDDPLSGAIDAEFEEKGNNE